MKMKILSVFILIQFVYVFGQTGSIPVPKIDFNPKHYVCYKVADEIKVDGKIKESSWQKALWTDEFVDIQGPSKSAPWFATKMKMLWDDEYMYFAAKLQDTNVWAKLKKRDSVIFYDNDFEVFIDPDGDSHQYYELEINAFNTVWDLFLEKPYRDGAKAMFYWDIGGLKTAVDVQGTINKPGDKDEGWTVEIAIPWDVLIEFAANNTLPQHGDQWRMNFSRVQWRTENINGVYKKIINPDTKKPFPEENWVWSPQGLINMHYPEMWGFVQFSDKIVGLGTDMFVPNESEKLKWALRNVYYAQKNYYAQNNSFTDDFSTLDLTTTTLKEAQWPPKIQITDYYFEASSTFKDKVFRINSDGKIFQPSQMEE